jgi:hypothetical protein
MILKSGLSSMAPLVYGGFPRRSIHYTTRYENRSLLIKLQLISCLKMETLPNSEWDGDLTFTGKCGDHD